MVDVNPDKSVVSINIEDEMRGAYLDYAMSVIIGRALPDVRDGLKPVHRRVLYAQYDLGNTHSKPYKKSARVVGDVIGKYHPHGDVAVYDTIVRMAQDFSLRYPLIDGQGNFGSIDGDAPAAMRYTEIRMARVTDELLLDIDKETVDFNPNYDESLTEPAVLPARFPNLLVNGSSGIAVGMATNIPPHNLGEVIDATIALIDKPELEVANLLEFVKGPDFPTAGYVFNEGLRDVYKSGRGVITIRGKAEIEPLKNDRESIVITELPYQVNKARLIEKIAELVKEKRLEGISDLRDESDRKGMRVVLDLKKGETSGVILNQLYKLTQLQDRFGISLLAIHQNQPRIMTLKEMLWAFVEHRKEVVLRRTGFDLKKAEARAHILEGLKRAVENLDPVIALIRAAKNPSEAKDQLIAKYALTVAQAQAILDMRLQRLTGLERDKILEEHRQTLELIADLKSILASEARIYQIIKTELSEIKATYADPRRTKIVAGQDTELGIEDLIADDPTLVTLTHQGYIRRTDIGEFRAQHRGGRGVRGVTTGDGDFVRSMFRTTNLCDLLCFTDRGRIFSLKVFKIPDAGRTGRGKAIVNLVNMAAGEKVKAVLPVREFSESQFVVMATKNGVIKKTALSEFEDVRPSGLIAIGIEDGDELISAKVTDGKQEIFLCTANGMSIRFPEDEVRAMGRQARGVGAMDLEKDDYIVGMEVLEPSADGVESEAREILTVTELGLGKRTPVSEYRLQGRNGRGILLSRLNERTGRVVGCAKVSGGVGQLLLVSSEGQMIRVKVNEISETGRVASGVILMRVEPNERVVAMEYDAEAQDEPEEGGTA